MEENKSNIALLLGDPAGIGPELISKLLKDEIIPAIEEAKKLGFNTDGPLPCDTSFVVAYKNKNHDCMVGMYHLSLIHI